MISKTGYKMHRLKYKFIKQISSCFVNDVVKKTKKQAIDMEKSFINYVFNIGLLPQLYKKLSTQQ